MPTTTAAAWTNWAGNQSARPARVVRPADVEGIAEVVKSAGQWGLRVKVPGSGHSFTGIASTDGVLMRLDGHTGLVTADRESGLVTVRAGTPLHLLNALLDGLGLAMTNLGDVDVQTIAGAVSTGTHGTGANLGGIATQIRALELVLADGSVVTCSGEERPDLFSAARVSLGALGIVSTVTLQCEPAFRLRAEEGPMSLDEVLARLDELVDGNEYFEFYFWPYTTRTLTKRNNRLRPGEQPQPLTRFRGWLEDEFLSNSVFGLMCRAARRFPTVVPRLNALAAQTLSARTYSDRSHRVFTSPRRVRFVEMEYCVPREAVRGVLGELTRVYDRIDLRVAFPVEVRFAAADDVWLSTAYERQAAYVAVHQFVGMPFEPYFREVEAIMGGAAGRPHWGKLHFLDAATLRERYPRFDAFVRLRDELDPDGRFSNDYLDRVLGPPPVRRRGKTPAKATGGP